MNEHRFTKSQVVLIVMSAVIFQRYLAFFCAKAAAFYWSRGDEKMAERLMNLATHFARVSMMHGELEESIGRQGARTRS
jgi:hypothetical protein